MQEFNENVVRIDRDTLGDLLSQVTGNVIAEADMPEMLREQIRNGARVEVKEFGRVTHTLRLNKKEQFELFEVQT